MSEKQEHLKIWDKVQTTNINFTSEVDINGFKGTSPNPMYLTKLATELFGPMGIGWGVDSIESLTETIGEENVYVSEHVRLWYIWNEKRGEVSQWSTIPMAYRTNQGKGYLRVDHEARKKCRTNAMSKCLSLLGFSADIWLKYYNSPAYLEAREKEAERDNRAMEIQEKYRAICQTFENRYLCKSDEDKETLSQWLLENPDLTLGAMQIVPDLVDQVNESIKEKKASGLEPIKMLAEAKKWKASFTEP